MEIGNTNRAIDIDFDESKEIFYLGTVPALSSFNEKKIEAGGTFPIKMMDRHVNLKYQGTEDDFIKYSGQSKKNDLFLKTNYNKRTNTFSYQQAMIAAFNKENLPDDVSVPFKDMLRVVSGEDIKRKKDGIIHGNTWAYELKEANDGSKDIMIEECEYFSNDMVTAVLIKNLYQIHEEELCEKDNAAIRALPIELESKDDFVRIAKHCIETGAQPDSFPHGDYYGFFYYDKNDKQIKTYGVNELLNPNENEPSDKETIIAKAKEISGGDWIIEN